MRLPHLLNRPSGAHLNRFFHPRVPKNSWPLSSGHGGNSMWPQCWAPGEMNTKQKLNIENWEGVPFLPLTCHHLVLDHQFLRLPYVHLARHHPPALLCSFQGSPFLKGLVLPGMLAGSLQLPCSCCCPLSRCPALDFESLSWRQVMMPCPCAARAFFSFSTWSKSFCIPFLWVVLPMLF